MIMRPATTDDVEPLVEMGIRFISAEFSKHFVASPAALRMTITSLVENADALFLVLEDNENIIRGTIGALTYCHPFSGELVATEMFWWVDPERRGGGLKLMLAAEDWARKRGAVKMQMGAPAGRDMADFYARIGYAEVERAYQKKL